MGVPDALADMFDSEEERKKKKKQRELEDAQKPSFYQNADPRNRVNRINKYLKDAE